MHSESVMKTNTRVKLQEAKYFLEQMRSKPADRNSFQCNLNAFLSAARSITFVMQTEFSEVLDFTEWYVQKQFELKNSKKMILLNDKRVLTIHKKSVKPRAHVKLSINEHIGLTDSVKVVIRRANGTTETTESKPTPKKKPAVSDTVTQWKWYYDDYPQEDIITLSEEQLATLETLVTDCEMLFNNKLSQATSG